jgi:peptidyl-prolyl cis-trans isomerase D
MLRALRSGGIVQVVMVGVVGAIIAVFVLEFRAAGGTQTGSLSRRCVVRVAGECVSPKDFYASYNLVVPRGIQAKHVKALDLRRHIAEGLVERELLLLEAERLGIDATMESLDEALARGLAHVSLPADQALRLGYTLDLTSGDMEGFSREMVRELPVKSTKTGEFDAEIYKRTVRNVVRRSPKEFKELQMRELVAARMRDLIRSRVRVSEEEAFQSFVRERSRAVVRTVQLDREWFARYAVDTSHTAVDTWSAAHKAEIDAEWKKATESWAEGCPLVSEILIAVAPNATDEEKVKLSEKAAEAKARVQAGEPFEAVARELSEGASAVVGGDLGCLEAERYGPGGNALVNAIKDKNPKDLSDVVETERGFHVLLFRGKLDEKVETTGRRALARSLMVVERGAARAEEFGKALLERVKADNALDAVTAALVEEFAASARVVVPKVDEKRPKKAKKDETEAASPGREAAYLGDRRRPRVEISSPFSMGGNPVTGALPTVSPARLAFALEKDGDVHPELIPTLNGFAVMQLKEKTPATREEFEAQKAELIRQLRVAKESEALVAYVDRLRKEHGERIERNLALVDDGTADDEQGDG